MRKQAGGRRTIVAGCLAALVAVWLLVGASVAQAVPAPIHIANTGGEGVYIRPEPSTARPGVGWMPEGASPDYICFTWGQNINGVPIWFNVTYNGKTGFYASYYDDSSYRSGDELTAKYGVPQCGSPPPPPAPAPAPAPAPVGPAPVPPPVAAPASLLNRNVAVAWARIHARDRPPYPASCTWFVSQALWAGGLPKTAEWTSAGSHGRFQKRPGTAAAWAVTNFVGYMLRQYPSSTFGQINFTTNKVPAAVPGDVIAYDWDGDTSGSNRSGLDHLSIVTSIQPGQYPEVSEWSIFDGTEPTTYTSRGWTWSQKSRQWLQKSYPKVKAYLLHIETNSLPTF